MRLGSPDFYLPPEQDMEHVRRLWDKYCAALAEKEVAVQSELSRLGRLQRLAEKVISDCKQGTTRVGELEEKIKEVRRQKALLTDHSMHCFHSAA